MSYLYRAKNVVIKITINNCRCIINMIYTVSNTSSFKNFAVIFVLNFSNPIKFLEVGRKLSQAPLIKYGGPHHPPPPPASYAPGMIFL
jgi:hypothetical protein